MGSKTHMEYRKADVATRAGKFAKASNKYHTQHKVIDKDGGGLTRFLSYKEISGFCLVDCSILLTL